MSIEKNLVFILPISPVLKEAKEFFEDKEDYIIYEIDSLNEYSQLIGILEHVITFSSDMKKTSRYLQDNQKYVSVPESLNIAVSNSTIPPHVLGKLQKYGLNEHHKSDKVNDKTITFKIENFFKKFDTHNSIESSPSELSKATKDNSFLSSKIIDTNSKQRIERMVALEDTEDQGKDSLVKSSGALNLKNLAIEGNSSFINSLKSKSKSSGEFLFTKMKSKKGLTLPEFAPKQKEWKQLDRQKKISKGAQGKKLDFLQREMQWKKIDRKETTGEGAKGKKLELFQRQMEWKKIDRENKSGQGAQGKKLDFLKRQMQWKKIDRKEATREGLKGKKLELFQRQMEWKQIDRERKTGEGAKGKKIDLIQNKKEWEKSNQDNDKGKGLIGKKLDLIQNGKGRENINQEDDSREGAKGKKLEQFQRQVDWEKGYAEEEVERNHGKSWTDHFDTKMSSKPTVSIEIDKKSKKKASVIIGNKKQDKDVEYASFKTIKKDLGEQTLNYKKLKEEYLSSGSSEDQEKNEIRKKELADKIAQSKEITYYYPSTDSIEYLVLYNSYYTNKKVDNISCLRFLQFSLKEALGGIVSFYLYKDEKYEVYHSGHTSVDLTSFGIENWEVLEKQVLDSLIDINIPSWLDETYSKALNQYIYPYYNDGILLGYAVAHFHKSIHTHDDALKAELLLMNAKGLFIKELEVNI